MNQSSFMVTVTAVRCGPTGWLIVNWRLSVQIWAEVWAGRVVSQKIVILQSLMALKSRLVAGFSGVGLVYFW